jgi:helix-hairpin-helix protein
MVFFHAHGIGTGRAVRIDNLRQRGHCPRLGHPYRLVLDMHGISCKTADTLAQRLGIPCDAIM